MTYLRQMLFVLFFVYLMSKVELLENGVARTPPMGWMSWGYYMCGVDCEQNPDKCLDEKLILSVADTFFNEGYQDSGYEYIIIDDCWSEHRRDHRGRLVPDRKRFPRGMKFISDYIHARGLKFGMYTNVAETTCMGYPGSRNNFLIDANTFAEWNVDYLKVDGCFVGEKFLNQDDVANAQMGHLMISCHHRPYMLQIFYKSNIRKSTDQLFSVTAYIQLGEFLNKTGRAMVYSCSWPYYIEFIHKKKPNLKNVSNHCNLWRNYHDVVFSWQAVKSIIHHYERSYDAFEPYHGPGHWNDPDMLIFGTGSLSEGQSRVQLSVYAMLSAPLLLSCDMLHITPYEKQLLQNMDLIAIGQDPLGVMARPYTLENSMTLWVKPHLPMKGDSFLSFSFAVVNMDTEEYSVSFPLGNYGLNNTDGYTIMDVFTSTYLKNVTLEESINLMVPAEDVILYSLFPL